MAAISRENNFDLIRLFASLQVLLFHGAEHMKLSSGTVNTIIQFLRFFPGVPIFFAISGFLIYGSFDRNGSNLILYFKNRVLRIFPALWVALIITVILLCITGFVTNINAGSRQFIFWLITQFSVFQFYTPDMLRGFGVGTPNGSLWTIPIEFTFYIFIPVLFWLSRKIKDRKNLVLLVMILISVLFNIWYRIHYLDPAYVERRSNLEKLYGLNLLPYLFYFLLGSLIYHNWNRIYKLYEGKGLYWLIAYIAYSLIFSAVLQKYEPSYWPDIYGITGTMLLVQATISMAFTGNSWSRKILKGNDISYGIYLYHMPVINTFIYYGYGGSQYLLLVTIISVVLATFSWKLVEKPALNLKKKKSLNPVS